MIYTTCSGHATFLLFGRGNSCIIWRSHAIHVKFSFFGIIWMQPAALTVEDSKSLLRYTWQREV